ncbi:pectinesterase 3 [Argentina anserina]|uniref:pectinesterase 3 n=1 Tax=Argentina anserina TaxID=57926 RepID=UPI0021766175|nr:pectinesterase 3 [Potentilla anserina]
MDSMTSFKGYGKVDELEEQAYRRKTRKRYIIVIVSVIVLVAVVIGAVTGTVIHNRNSSSSPSQNSPPAPELTPSASLKGVCQATQYPNSCFSSISTLKNSNTTDPEALFRLALHVAIDEVSKLRDFPSTLKSKIGNDTKLSEALKLCESLFVDAVDRLNDSLTSMEEVSSGGKRLTRSVVYDLRTWISATMTDQETCLDSLEELNSTLVQEFRDAMQNATEYSSNGLAIVTKIIYTLAKLNDPGHRRLLGSGPEFPSWVSPGYRRLLQAQNVTAAHVTVAKDGTGDFKTIQEAVDVVPKKNLTRFVIYVKQGTYLENVIMDKNKWNVMMYGDGKDKTIVSGSLNFVDGTATFKTATFAVAGKGFIAKDMGFINTAGAEKHQAVAFRSGSDQSVYYRCSFDAFQDTLYAHSNRQFYRDCDITGTIDFIFGNAAVVLQNCNIKPRQPMPNQFNTITAQGKKDENQNTGISIQKCTISPLESNMTALTYLGRPWKEFSTTVVMQSTIDINLDPLGWKEWVSNVEPPSSIFYAEYQNSGQGSSVDKRVTWAGYIPSLTKEDATRFTVDSFIQGNEWLPQTNVNFENSL